MDKPTVKELLTKIERLEARIRQLEASQTVTHNHYHYAPQPLFGPTPTWQPSTPALPWIVTCVGSS